MQFSYHAQQACLFLWARWLTKANIIANIIATSWLYNTSFFLNAPKAFSM
jgi:hypothetical protein